MNTKCCYYLRIVIKDLFSDSFFQLIASMHAKMCHCWTLKRLLSLVLVTLCMLLHDTFFSLQLIWQFYGTWSLAWHSVWFTSKDILKEAALDIWTVIHITATYLTTSRPVCNCLCTSLTATNHNNKYLPKIWKYFSEQMHQGQG